MISTRFSPAKNNAFIINVTSHAVEDCTLGLPNKSAQNVLTSQVFYVRHILEFDYSAHFFPLLPPSGNFYKETCTVQTKLTP